MLTPQIVLGVTFFMVIYGIVDVVAGAQKRRRVSSTPNEKPLRTFLTFGGGLPFNRAIVANESYRRRIETLLVRSGNPLRVKVEEFVFLKELSACFVVLYASQMQWPFFIWIALGGVGFLVPDMLMRSRVGQRMKLIQRQLPGFVDLVAMAMESGMDLLAAFERILDRMKPGPFKDEVGMVIQENRLGTPRKVALQHLADRVDVSDVQSMVSMIIQSEELGTALSAVLRSYAEDMRNRRITRAEEAAGKAPVKILFPMMVFFLPVVFIVVLGPIALSFFSGPK